MTIHLYPNIVQDIDFLATRLKWEELPIELRTKLTENKDAIYSELFSSSVPIALLAR